MPRCCCVTCPVLLHRRGPVQWYHPRLTTVCWWGGIGGNGGTGRNGNTAVKKNGPFVPSRRRYHVPLKHTAPSRRKTTDPSYRPVSSRRQKKKNVPFRREVLHLLFRPAVKMSLPSRHVPLRKNMCEPSRSVVNIYLPSRRADKTWPYCPVPPSPRFPLRQDTMTVNPLSDGYCRLFPQCNNDFVQNCSKL